MDDPVSATGIQMLRDEIERLGIQDREAEIEIERLRAALTEALDIIAKAKAGTWDYSDPRHLYAALNPKE